MSHPRISIVTANLNHGRFLERTLCSVLDQGYDALEYCVVDGGSTDESLDILKLYEDQLTWWISGPDAGPAAAINKALRRISGDLVVILPAGDLLLPQALHHVAERFAQQPDCRWLVGDCLRLDSEDRMLGTLAAARPRSFAGFLMHNSGFLPLSSSVFAMTLLKRYGLFDESRRYTFDYELACRLLAAGEQPRVMERPLASHRIHEHRRGFDELAARGMEYISAAERYRDHLPLTQRYALWRTCDQRRRIYALAAAESAHHDPRRQLWQQALRHPWWLADSAFRHRLMHGLPQPAPAATPLPAESPQRLRPAA